MLTKAQPAPISLLLPANTLSPACHHVTITNNRPVINKELAMSSTPPPLSPLHNNGSSQVAGSAPHSLEWPGQRVRRSSREQSGLFCCRTNGDLETKRSPVARISSDGPPSSYTLLFLSFWSIVPGVHEADSMTVVAEPNVTTRNRLVSRQSGKSNVVPALRTLEEAHVPRPKKGVTPGGVSTLLEESHPPAYPVSGPSSGLKCNRCARSMSLAELMSIQSRPKSQVMKRSGIPRPVNSRSDKPCTTSPSVSSSHTDINDDPSAGAGSLRIANAETSLGPSTCAPSSPIDVSSASDKVASSALAGILQPSPVSVHVPVSDKTSVSTGCARSDYGDNPLYSLPNLLAWGRTALEAKTGFKSLPEEPLDEIDAEAERALEAQIDRWESQRRQTSLQTLVCVADVMADRQDAKWSSQAEHKGERARDRGGDIGAWMQVSFSSARQGQAAK